LGTPAPGACCTDVNIPGVSSSPAAEEVDTTGGAKPGPFCSCTAENTHLPDRKTVNAISTIKIIRKFPDTPRR
jgi:hypothetical protein